MSFTAIICEFNPLHHGHEHILREGRNLGGDVLCLMSGNFVERGEPAILEKSIRARHAVLGGADVVFELPPYFAVSNAETFAYGAVTILDKLGVDKLLFGSECGDIDLLTRLADLLNDEPAELKGEIKRLLDSGTLYAKARTQAVENLYGKSLADALSTPNNILGVEYIRAIKNTDSKITPYTTKRVYDPDVYTSSTKIRERVYSNEIDLTANHISSFVSEDLANSIDKTAVDEKLFTLLKFTLSTKTSDELKSIAEVNEGLENRLIAGIKECDSLPQFLDFVKSKRYTMAKIKRIALNVLLSYDKELSKKAFDSLDHVKALAIKADKRELLGKFDAIKVITNSKMLEKDELYLAEKRADDLYRVLTEQNIPSQDVHNVKII